MPGRIRIGISGWSYAGWRGVFYPSDLPPAQELAYTARRMTTLEINGTFYSLHSPMTYGSWGSDALTKTLSPHILPKMNKSMLVLSGLCAASIAALSPSRAGEPSASKGVDAEIQWVRISSGSFWMGANDGAPNEKPVHSVTLRAFDMSKSAVTFKQYRACVAAEACTPPHVSDNTCYLYDGLKWNAGKLPDSYQGDDQPVVCVSWNQARAFAQWAGGRLPSEAEWAYAARSEGKDRVYPWGDEKATCERAVMNDGLPGCGRGQTWPVCSKPKGNTDQGLCDMAGNTWEWVQDWYHPSYTGAPSDGSAWEVPPTEARVYRGGGAWYATAEFLRTTIRESFNPSFRGYYFGFRVARSAPTKPR